MPDDTSAVQYVTGINAPGGPVEYFIIRGDCTWAADPAAADVTNLVTSLRIVLNGEVVFDFRAGSPAAADNTPGQFGYLLNSIGGRAYEVPGGTTTREWYWGIPLGQQTPNGVNRYEVIVGWTTAAGNISSGNISYWLKYNDAMQTTTNVVPSTSFAHAASIEQVVVRVPQNVPGVVSAILVQNDQEADELGAQGIRVNAISDFGLEPGFLRWLNADLENGIMYADPADTSQQTYAAGLAGTILIPTFGLTGGDVVLTVDSSATATRTYTPIITAPVGAKAAPEVVQTQKAPGNTAKAIVRKTESN